ncbi:MAG: hydroxylamine reductase [Spirochaetota bacterium]|nr:hydroxylamine reductase [Spirochaetota bacterium]
MFCYQCQETAKNRGCSVKGACGKTDETANLQDLLIFVLKGISIFGEEAKKQGIEDPKLGLFISQALFTTITNVNFDSDRIISLIQEGLKIKEILKKEYEKALPRDLHESALWFSDDFAEFHRKAAEVGIHSTENEDVRSLRELLIYGLKGIAAYAHHAEVLGYRNQDIYDFQIDGLASTTKDLTQEEMVNLVLKAGKIAVETMTLLDEANTRTYGNPEITEVDIGVKDNPGILISGHDLKDLEELLEQTKGTGVDVYTHGEMLPANYYPAFKRYKNLIGNYGGSWWRQKEEFESFNGPILFTTNCLVPPRDSYKDRVFTTDVVGYPGIKHIPDRTDEGSKDFSEIIEMAKKCRPPVEIESGKIVGGFAHDQIITLADKVIDAIKSGAIKRFVVMAGCDGRHKERDYFTEVAQGLPEDAVILTAGCAKYRYNKLNLGEIDGIPRVLDAGQCNDSYSLAVVALKLKEIFQLEDINELPISYDIAWYEQKAVAVLLALLYLGIKGIRLGPSLPAFLSTNVVKVLIENFDIKPIGRVKADINSIMAGK